MGKDTTPTPQTTSNPPQTTTPLLIAPKTRDHCTQNPDECLTVVNAMSKAKCAEILAQPANVKALQDAMTAELAKVIKAEYKSDYEPELELRPSMRCGSLMMQAVVGDTIAPQLREHYSSGSNELKLEVGGQPLLFVPQPTTTSSTTKTSTTTTTKLRTATSNQPAMVTSIDKQRLNLNEEDDQHFVIGLDCDLGGSHRSDVNRIDLRDKTRQQGRPIQKQRWGRGRRGRGSSCGVGREPRKSNVG